MADDRRSGVKEAALVGLVIMDSEVGKEKMLKILSSGKFKSAIKAAKRCADPAYGRKIFDLVKQHYNEVVAPEKKGAQHFVEMLTVLNAKDEDYVQDFLVSLFAEKNRLICCAWRFYPQRIM